MIILIIFIIILIFPLVGFSISILYTLIIGPKNKIQLFVLAFLICLGGALLGFLYNPEFQDTGDITRYYQEFYKLKNYGGFDIYSSKYIFYFFYYYILNYFLRYNDPRIITAISVFLIYFNFIIAFYIIIKNDYRIKSFRILFLLLFIFSPFLSIMSSYRNLLALSFFFMGIVLLSFNENKNKIGSIYLICSCFFHPSLILLILIYVFTKITEYRIKLKNAIYIYILMYISIIFISKLPQTTNLVWFLQAKIRSYIFNKSTINIREIIFSIRYIILYFFNFWLLLQMENKKFNYIYIRFLWNYYILILFFIINKSIFMRYLFISLPIFFPIYLYIYKKSPVNIKYRKIIFFIITILLIHIGYFRFWSIEKIGDGFLLSIFFTIKDIINYPLKFKI